jgi:hypothetical protein
VAETCNSRDDNCDGHIDEGLGSISCGVGSCQKTVDACVFGRPGVCNPGSPVPETCNGFDDDCNGAVDDGLGTISCGVGACAVTINKCANGVPQTTCTPGSPGPEDLAHLSSCNNQIDDDCDGATDLDCAVLAGTQTTLSGEGQVTGGLALLGAIEDADASQTIVETVAAGANKKRLSQVFRFTTLANIQFNLRVEGQRNLGSNDSFDFVYAKPANGICPTTTNNQGWTTTSLSITKTADDDQFQSVGIGSAATTVWCVRVQDSSRNSDSQTDTLTLDKLYLFPAP